MLMFSMRTTVARTKHESQHCLSTWQNPVEVPILHLLIVLILLKTEDGVRQVPVNEPCLLCFCQPLQQQLLFVKPCIAAHCRKAVSISHILDSASHSMSMLQL